MEPREIVRISLVGSLVILVVWHLSSHSTFTLGTDPAPTAFEALTMLRSSRPVRIRLQGSAPVRAQAYSRWRCVGDLETIGAAPHRTCVFERVCYHPNQSDFTFHARPNSDNVSLPTIYDHRKGSQYGFRWRKRQGARTNDDFIPLSKEVPYKHQMTWSASTVAAPVPANAAWLTGLSALSAPFAPTNLGHVAWDEGFPLLVGMAQLGVYTPALRILRTTPCSHLGKRATSSSVCRKFAAAFLAPLMGQASDEPHTLDAVARGAPVSGATGRRDGTRPVCFEKLLVGGTFDSFNLEALNSGKEPLIALYRAQVLAAHGIAPDVPPTRHTILLVAKKGRRIIANFKRVQAAVRSAFSSMATIVSTDFSGMTMREQLRLVSSTTVAVSPCGGISMILPFMPEGSHAVLVNYMLGEGEEARHGECDHADGPCSWTMEAELWRHVRHVTKVYYQVWGPDDFAKGRPGRDESVRIDPARLIPLIRASLHEMEPF